MKIYNDGEVTEEDKQFIVSYLTEIVNEIRKNSIKNFKSESSETFPLTYFEDNIPTSPGKEKKWKHINISFSVKNLK
ncbi:MAG: hypothetical protein ACOC2W_01250 [bacterium]